MKHLPNYSIKAMQKKGFYRNRYQKFLHDVFKVWHLLCTTSASIASWSLATWSNCHIIENIHDKIRALDSNLLVELPSWFDDWSLSSSIDLGPPPNDVINIEEIRSLSRWLSNSPGISTSSLLLVLRLRLFDPFGGNSSMKPPAHNGHVYSWIGDIKSF